MSDNLAGYGFIEELYLMGASKQTICKMTKLPLEQVERVLYQIEKNRKILANQNKEEYKC